MRRATTMRPGCVRKTKKADFMTTVYVEIRSAFVIAREIAKELYCSVVI